MKRIRTSYVIPVVGIISITLVVLGLLWCKGDGIVSINRGFRSTKIERIRGIRVSAGLNHRSMHKEPGVLFKQRIVWSGPSQLWISLRDYDREFQKARLTRCHLQSRDATWSLELVPVEQSSLWRDFNAPKHTDKYNTTGFRAKNPDKEGCYILLPEGVRTFTLNVEFKLVLDGNVETFRKTFTLKPTPNQFMSYGFSYRMVAP